LSVSQRSNGCAPVAIDGEIDNAMAMESAKQPFVISRLPKSQRGSSDRAIAGPARRPHVTMLGKPPPVEALLFDLPGGVRSPTKR
jgi:hypothetical protein